MAEDGKAAGRISLWAAFAAVPGPRQASGRRHPLPAVPTPCSAAVLSGARSLYAVARFGRGRGKDFAAASGFTREAPPCRATLFDVLRDLDPGAFEAAARRRARGRCRSAGWGAVDLDGKSLRGTQGHRAPGVHLPAAYAREARAALGLLDLLPVKDKGATGDGEGSASPAMFRQRVLSREVGKKGGLGPAREGEPAGPAGRGLRRLRRRGASPRGRRLAAAERQTASAAGKGHGRPGRRTLTSATSLGSGCLEWPGVGQCSRLVRERTAGGTTTAETAYGITSLAPAKAGAPRLLKLTREHWSIESLFRVRGVTFGEDACRAATGTTPIVLSALRNAAIALLDRDGATNKAALRRHAAHPGEALALVEGGSG